MSAITTTPTDASFSDNTMLNADPVLAAILSRLAGLQGHAVPEHRFGMLAQTEEGVELSSLKRMARARELWLARFPEARVHSPSLRELSRSELPLLWLSENEEEVLLVRARLASGAMIAEDHAGHRRELSVGDINQGQLLALAVSTAQPGEAAHPQRSASEWFALCVRRHRKVFAEAVLATFMISVIGLMAALYTMQVYDRVVPTKGFSTLWVLTIGVLMAIGLELTMKLVRASLVDRVCKVIDQELSAVFFGKALDIRMDARPRTVGTFAAQIRHFESVRNFMTSSSLFILADAPFALFFIVVIAMLAGPVALVPVVMVPLAVIAGLCFRNPIERHTAEHMAESNRKNGLLIEMVDGIESVKATGSEWKMLEHWRRLTATIAGSELKMKGLSTLATNLTQTIQQLSYVGLIAAGAYAISNGHLTMGGLIACSIISGRALAPMGQIPGLIVQWKNAKIALQALDGIMAMPSDRDSHERLVVPEQCEGHIRLENTSFAYEEAHSVLAESNIAFKPGDRVAVLGAVGSGKSTLIKLLSGLYKPTSGRVLLDEVDITQLAPEFVREQVGYLPQDIRLFHGTLRENLALGLPAPSDSQILHAARLTGLDKIILAHPRGLELEIAEGGRGLSGGQRQLVGLTRLLLAQPRIMLLDEPTASMDAQLETKVMRHLFDELPDNSVVVVVTHKLALLQHVDRIIVMEQGRVAIDGARDEVLARLRQPVANHAAQGEAGAA